jgi:hypothetical protein
MSKRYLLQRHPFRIQAWFRHSLVLTYAFPADQLETLLPPGLWLDTFEGFGFLAVAVVETHGLRPAFLPAVLGQDFILAGYRVFCRFRGTDGRWRRGLRILRSDANRRRMVWGGNLLTHYHYRLSKAGVAAFDDSLGIEITTAHAEADLRVTADLRRSPAAPPPGSPFLTWREARLFAGPMPFTFDYEPETHSIIAIEGVRLNWRPRPVTVQIECLTFLDQPPFNQSPARLANAFHVRDIAYTWKRGVRHALS